MEKCQIQSCLPLVKCRFFRKHNSVVENLDQGGEFKLCWSILLYLSFFDQEEV